MKKIVTLLALLLAISTNASADDIPDPNAQGMRKVLGLIADIEQVDSSKKGGNDAGPITGNPVVDLGVMILDDLVRTNYRGFPIYYVKVNESILLEVASKESFKMGDCVVVWYRDEMGDNPNLSMLGDAGIAKSNECSK
jgi:hypothetical protein